MFRVVLECSGIPESEGPEAAADITKEFAENRQHHSNVRCLFAGGTLTLIAENDWDEDGRALMDEFSDLICAYVSGYDGESKMILKSSTRI